jgi:hypothetical protein
MKMILGFDAMVDCATALNCDNIMNRKNRNCFGFML